MNVQHYMCMFSPRDGCFDTAEAYLQLDMLVLSLDMQIEALYAHLGPNYACWCLNDPFHSQMCVFGPEYACLGPKIHV